MALKPQRKRRVGFLLFDGMTALDVVGPMEAFAAASVGTNTRDSVAGAYELLTVGISQQEVTAESGIVMRPQTTLAKCPALDTIVIAGGRGLREARTNQVIATWVKTRAQHLRRIASVCTGIYAVAPTGLLDGRRVVTHWHFALDLSRRFPALRVDGNALFLKDGKFYTSAGITAGIDLSLALIEEDLGKQAALRVARELVVYMKRPGGQAQYSEPLRFQSAATDELHEVDAYIRAHLDEKLSVASLARFVCLSERHFSRRFQRAYKTSPAVYVERLKLDEARSRLAETGCRIDQLAFALGFGSDDAFRRAFERRFGIAPNQYRSRFGPGSEENISSHPRHQA